jgi:hypothetical protein
VTQATLFTNDVCAYEGRPRNDKRGVELISDVLPFGRDQTLSVMQSVTYSITADQRAKESKVCYAVNGTILRERRGGGSIANHSGA